MSRGSFDRKVFRDLSWWHWTCTIPLLAVHLLAGSGWAIWTAIALCGAVGIYFLVRIRRLRPWPVQVRIAYLGLLAIGILPGMQWIHWVQLFGTTARVTVGYCLLIRILSLAPFNRNELMTARLMWRVLVQEPCVGGLVSWSGASSRSVTRGCSAATFTCSSLD